MEVIRQEWVNAEIAKSTERRKGKRMFVRACLVLSWALVTESRDKRREL